METLLPIHLGNHCVFAMKTSTKVTCDGKSRIKAITTVNSLIVRKDRIDECKSVSLAVVIHRRVLNDYLYHILEMEMIPSDPDHWRTFLNPEKCKAFNLKELDDGAREWLHNNGIDSVEPIDLYIY